MTFTISPAIKQCWPETALGLLLYQVQVAPSPPQLLAQFDQTVASLAQQYTLDTIAKHPHIAATRQAYKALGASPHEHRNAAEAMLRRVVKQAGLYHINNVVEVNNLISISSGYAIGSYDLDQLQGQVVLACPRQARYEGIGRESLHRPHARAHRRPGPLRHPSSDSRRAMIQPGLRRVASVLYAFDGAEGLVPGCRPLRRRCGPTAASPP
ncbi:MAG: B3/4 domain-containing protein [Evtepia gabavorous]